MSLARPRRISEINNIFGKSAQTSHYEVNFGGLSSALSSYLRRRRVSTDFITREAGLRCFNASLPTTSFATTVVDGNYLGIQENFAHTRQFNSISLEFYVDLDYKMLNFLEIWQEFIASGSYAGSSNAPTSLNRTDYFYRMQYPSDYKVDFTRIIKFDRDYERRIEYFFRGLFPVAISGIPVGYDNSRVLSVNATFAYDRYIAGRSYSINEFQNDANNVDPLAQREENLSPSPSVDDILRNRIRESEINFDINLPITSGSDSSQQANPFLNSQLNG